MPNPPCQSLEEIEASIASANLPPVAQWQPDRESVMDLVIQRDGRWLYSGSPIHREPMVQLFSTVLRLEDDGQYCLVTPYEKLIVRVEDAPFIATGMTLFPASESAQKETVAVVFETNVGDKVILDQQHGLHLETDERGHPKPYLHVRDGLRALLSRSVYYQLVEACNEREGNIGIASRGYFHVLGAA